MDASFNGNGKVTNTIVSSGMIYSVALQSDGKIVAAGGSTQARYNTNGSLDINFGDNGLVPGGGRNVTIQHDGKIVVSRGSDLTRYNADGSFDTSFGDNGAVTGGGGAGVVSATRKLSSVGVQSLEA